MIYGIGTDICDIRRIRASLDKFGPRFAKRIMAPTEFNTYLARAERSAERGVAFVATRFSAKEAFSKAIGMGMRMPMTWSACEVGHLPSGKPCIVLHGDLKTWFESRGLSAHVTVSDEVDYACAFVVVEKN